ncbi:myo-inositol 2-dehydrogenase/D-chiro-inositol 1-dehydrogenase [Sinorhizobium fredii]|uniref:Inositol 2-dehydrogenase n=1 Tax=Sinorhizobium fredii (strain USDA 257) TaxID=1185652 RepID=I3X5I6_SINF2|nr:Gfo/Idh/MocA family oxidoreductase [Sinorhizobium fredii]AFL51142.1 inositol 2-dehydrogenase IolG [Sinorhizobium fredii USDA 257]
MTLRVGVIGTGMIGQDHIRRLTQVLSAVEVVAVSDIDGARAAAVAPEGAEIFATAGDLIRSETVEAVVICSWGPAHEEQLLDCIAAGKPVFCEKPLVTTAAAALRVMEAEVAFGRRLVQVGFMRRFDADYRRLKATLDAGILGAPLMFHSTHRNAAVPEGLYTSEMPLNDTLVHDADISRWLLKDEVTGVEVRVPRRSRRGNDLRDPVMVLLHMGSGALVDVEISVNITYGYDIRGEVSCEEGTASLPLRPATVIRDIHGVRHMVPADWRERFIEAYDQEFREWTAAAGQGTATGPSTWDGYAATLVADAALRAVETGALEPVRMCERPSLYAGGRTVTNVSGRAPTIKKTTS